ncbi:tubulin glycylase 3A-like, partial [Asbolus verrucosus]
MVSPLVVSAPSSPKHTIKSDTSSDVMKRSNSCIENKYKCTITSERLTRLRKIVETAVKEHKVFTIKGGWPIIRREMLKRNWIEKYEPAVTKAKSTTAPNTDDLISNLPIKHDWESPTAYIEKCEKTIMSRMLQNFDVDFYWSMRKDQSDLLHRSNAYKLMNRFSKSLFASKEGLALLLQQHYWYSEPGVASINFPRCYVLGFPDHFNNFVDDFRITACMGLLKWLVHKYDTEDKFGIQSPEGQVPLISLQFAIDRCSEFVEVQKHLDIDKEYPRIWDHEWEQFLSHYFLIMHKNGLFDASTDHPLTMYYIKAKNVLNELVKFWPEFNMDGMKNIWILKPGNKCRGRGIQLIKNIAEVEKVMTLKLKYVVQKYIEKPLLIHQTKFDIRQWFIVANSQPLTIWMYRFSSQIFTLDNFHESLHLTNHAVQCKYTNVEQRDKALPQDNMWDCHTFQTYLKQSGVKEKWNEVILPGMREGIVCAMLASQDVMDRRQNTFELYGADFMISEDFKPWLIEINCSPDLSSSTSVTSRMCPQCMEDLVKVVIDRRKDPTADTGLFDLVYRQNLPRVPPYLGMNLSVRGRKIFRSKNKLRQQSQKDKPKDYDNSAQLWLNKKQEQVKTDLKRSLTAPTNLPKLSSSGMYKGPVIEDLIDDLSKSLKSPKIVNMDVIKVPKSEPVKKKCDTNRKKERVSKKGRYYRSKINKVNFISRKQNAKENIKDEDSDEHTTKNYLGLLNEWASRNKSNDCTEIATQKGDGVWERETASILKVPINKSKMEEVPSAMIQPKIKEFFKEEQKSKPSTPKPASPNNKNNNNSKNINNINCNNNTNSNHRIYRGSTSSLGCFSRSTIPPRGSHLSPRRFSSSTHPALLLRKSSSSNRRISSSLSIDPLKLLKDEVHKAIREHKTFTVRGQFSPIRKALLARGWVEKFHISYKDHLNEELKRYQSYAISELLPLMKKEELTATCKNLIKSKLLGGYQVDFYWGSSDEAFKENPDKIKLTIINKLKREIFSYTNKQGLCEASKYSYWYQKSNVSKLNHPRSYSLTAKNGELKGFTEDFNMTAAMSLLKWIVKTNITRECKLISPSGKVPLEAFEFALNECCKFIKRCKHEDIDTHIPEASDHEWNKFLEYFYKIVHYSNHFAQGGGETADSLVRKSNYILNTLKEIWPYVDMDGMMNIWILKPTASSRGRGIHMCRTLQYVLRIIKQNSNIRECYLRFSSQTYNLRKLHESIHLTNNSVQCKYKNASIDAALPSFNMWDSNDFQKYLTNIGYSKAFKNIIYPGMKQCITAAVLMHQDKMVIRRNCFELYGADFILTEDFQPWLLEINSNPALYASTPVTSRMCPKVLDDVIKVVIDYAHNIKANTGGFEMIYKEQMSKLPSPSALEVKGLPLKRDYFYHGPNEQQKAA